MSNVTATCSVDRLPRTVAFVRAGKDDDSVALVNYIKQSHIPEGTPVFVMLDQRALPQQEVYKCTADWREVMDAIATLAVRGAPALGIAGAAAVALRAAEFCWAKDDSPVDELDFDRTFVLDERAFDPEMYAASLEFVADMVARTRPTAVNLRWGIDRALACVRAQLDAGAQPHALADALFNLVVDMIAEDEATNRAIGAHGAALLPPKARVLTYCNAGSLATAFYGTAVGIVYAAASEGDIERVWACETRPVNQGARLTVWELARAGVPVTLICDNMAAATMREAHIDAVVVGADRIAKNGDVANKIGTYGLAILAHYHNIPFYVAAPTSTIDLTCTQGSDILIERRATTEVLDTTIAGVEVDNPAFDVTPAELVSAIITEQGVFAPCGIEQMFAISSMDEV